MRPLVLALGLLPLAACSSIQGTYVGSPQHGEDIGGLPIVLERARWLEVTYKDVNRALVAENTAASTGAGGTATKEFVILSEYPTVRVIEVDVATTQEVYAIDVKRPAAGTIDYELDLAGQYPTKIKAVIEDKTIEAVGAVLDQLLEQINPTAVPTSAALPAGLSLVTTSESVVRIEYYDLEQLAQGVATPAFVLQ